MKKIIIDIELSAALGIGIMLLFTPLGLWWLLGTNLGRYLWIIYGPPPFSSLGSAPVQLGISVLAVFSGILLIIITAILKRRG